MANYGEREYLDLLDYVLEKGCDRGDRTGTGTRSLFGHQIRFDLNEGFPLLTTKKVFLRGIIEELLWFLRGSTNAKELEDKNVNIWRGWGDPETRELGPVYGKQWRNWESPVVTHHELPGGHRVQQIGLKQIDQISELVTRLKADPNSRRHLVVAWNPGEVDRMALPPCHCLFQFYVKPLSVEERRAHNAVVSLTYDDEEAEHDRIDERATALGEPIPPRYALSCQLYQRSADIFLGVPFNIASYALLTMMLAQQCGYALGEFVHTFGDVHLYHNHFEQAREQLSREPREFPTMTIRRAKDIFSYEIDDFELTGYDPHPTIKAPVAI